MRDEVKGQTGGRWVAMACGLVAKNKFCRRTVVHYLRGLWTPNYSYNLIWERSGLELQVTSWANVITSSCFP